MAVANPFKHLLAAINEDQSLAIRGCEETFQYWLIRDGILKQSLAPELYAKFQGIQLYAFNDFFAVDLES